MTFRRVARVVPGGLLCGAIALAATGVAALHGGPQMLYALLFGTTFHFLVESRRAAPGIGFCSTVLLRLGIGLLGARITLEQVAGLGWSTAAVVIGAVVSTLLAGWAVARRLGLSASHGVLAGGAVAICGASAALAIAAVLPKHRDLERNTVTVVVGVTLLSTLAMIVYPLVARALALPPALAGLFIGGTIHDVAQVAVAGYTLGGAAGDSAMIVKLFRVALLALVVLGVALGFHAHGGQRPRGLLPWFLLLFVALAAANSAGWLPPGVRDAMQLASRACLTLGVAAIGVKTSYHRLAAAGWRPIAVLAIVTLWLALFVLAAAVWLRP